MQDLIQYIEQFARLDADAVNALKNHAEIEIYKKNEYLLEPGQYCDKIWYLKKGMVRKYHLAEGEEITAWIHIEHDILTSLQSYALSIPSVEYLQACEATELISISKLNSRKLALFPPFLIFSNELMSREFARIDCHTKAFNSLDAKGRYEYLRKIAPGMVRRAKLGHIASIIGITPETLSRIRKN